MGWYIDLDMLSADKTYYSSSKPIKVADMQRIVKEHRIPSGNLRPFETLILKEAFEIFAREYENRGFTLRKIKVGKTHTDS